MNPEYQEQLMEWEDPDGTGRDEHVCEAFSLLADETRLHIVDRLRGIEEPLSYTEIKNDIGIRDSGRFSYHLNKLVGTFVTQTEEGYTLSHSADAVYQAILSTRPLSEHPTLERSPQAPCPDCGTEHEFQYENELLRARCPECEKRTFGYPFPAGGFEGRSDEEVLRAAVQRMYHHVSLVLEGICPYCSGPTNANWTREHDTPLLASVLARHDCSLCGVELNINTSVAGMIQVHPVVVSLFDDYGLRPRRLLPWEFQAYLCRDELSVLAEDPFRIVLPVEIEGDRYRLLVTERSDGGADVDVQADLRT